MARKPTDAAKAKAAKQKKILIALSVVLVIALAYAYHTMQGLSGGGTPAAVTTPVATTPAATTPAATTPAATTPAATTPATTTPASTVPTGSPTILVSAVRPAADTGQLQSFSRFESKDPFAAAGPKPSGSTSAKTGSPSAPAQKKAATPPAPPPSSAVIAVNGVAALVVVNSDFPVSVDPTQNGLFHLVALSAKTATVSVVGGSYATGAATLTLKVDRPVTLVNTADGKRYTLQLFPQGTPAPAGATTASPATTTTTATTP